MKQHPAQSVTDVGMSVHFVESRGSIFDIDVAMFIGKRIGRTFYRLAITTNHQEDVACLSSSTSSQDIPSLLGYTDADYTGYFQTRQSTSGFIFLLNGDPVAWSSRRQPCVALSTTKAKFIAACKATKEGIWIRRLHLELFTEWNKLIPIKCVNQSAIKLIKNPSLHQIPFFQIFTI
jgi:hypothetical protein